MSEKLTAKQLNDTAPYTFGNELDYIKSIKLNADSKVVMIGAGPGVMALALLEDQEEEFEFDIIDNNTCHWVHEHLKAAELMHDNIHFILQDSATWGEAYEGKPVDLLIIDGDHSYEGVTADINAWYPHVKKNGIIFFHDVIDPKTGKLTEVDRAINKFQGKMRRENEVGISSIYRKG